MTRRSSRSSKIPAGNVLDVGRRRRTIPTLLRRALRLRDRGCRFPGCTNRHVDGHHVVPWARGGATALENLCSLCRRHHTHVHEYGFRMENDGAGGFQFFRPDGVEVTAAGAAPVLPSDPVEVMRARAPSGGNRNRRRGPGSPCGMGGRQTTSMQSSVSLDRRTRRGAESRSPIRRRGAIAHPPTLRRGFEVQPPVWVPGLAEEARDDDEVVAVGARRARPAVRVSSPSGHQGMGL